jgi:hypothetical protein
MKTRTMTLIRPETEEVAEVEYLGDTEVNWDAPIRREVLRLAADRLGPGWRRATRRRGDRAAVRWARAMGAVARVDVGGEARDAPHAVRA